MKRSIIVYRLTILNHMNNYAPKKKKICFFSLNAYPVLKGSAAENIGGAELQQVLIGNELTKRGYDISFIVFDFGQPIKEIYNGVTIIKTIPRKQVITGISSLYNTIRSIYSALYSSDADIFYIRGSGRDAGIVAIYSLFTNKTLIFATASDMDVDGTFLKSAKLYEKFLYKLGLWRCKFIITQSEYQKNLLSPLLKKKARVIKNVYQLKKTDVEKKTPPRVLWVGTIKPLWKQPNLFLEVAKKIPETQFIMIGGRSLDNEFFLKIKHEAESIPNLEFKGFIPLSRIEEFFKEASIFVNTSTNEGFPNTFLQAWANYTPVISLNIDPDEIICKYTLGFHSKNFEQFIRDLQLLLDDSDLRQKMGSNGRKYVEDNHDFDLIMERYIALLASIE